MTFAGTHPSGPTGEGYNDIYIDVGKFSDAATPEFRPSTITGRVGDRVEFNFNSILDTYTLVQAKSAEEPCTRDPRGLYAEFTKPSDEMKNDPDIDQKMGLGYALYIPYSANESTIHFYAEGHCEQGMRAQFVVSGFADVIHSSKYLGSSKGSLSKSAKIGIIIGVIVAALLLVAVLAHFIHRKIRSKKTEKMKGRMAHMVVDAQVIAHDDGRNRPSTQGAATSSV